MKKTFRFLALSFALICGTLSSIAQPAGGPAIGTKVGNYTGLGVVVYEVKAWNAGLELADGTKGAYEVEITGLNWEGIQNPRPTELTIKLAFQEMYGTTKPYYVVTSIKNTNATEKGAFYAQTQLTKLEFVNDLTVTKDSVDFTIGDYSFYGCSKLKDLIFPGNVTSIGEYAFQDTAVEDFKIPGKCATIEPFAFYNCKKLNKVTVLGSIDADGKDQGGALTALEGKVFANSTLHELDLSKAYELVTIGAAGSSPFLYNLSDINDQLTTVTLPAKKGTATQSKVNNVFSSFKNCTALESIANLDITKITSFTADAFNNCQKLGQLDFPIGEYETIMLGGTPFAGCESLTALTFAKDFWGTIGDGTNNLFDENTLEDIPAALDVLETITFKGSLNGQIAGKAFGDDAADGEICTSLNTLTITDGLKGGSYNNGADLPFGATIAANAFSFCDALETVNLNGVNIGGGNKLANTVTIEAGSFTNTGIKHLNIGNIVDNNEKGTVNFTLGAAFSSEVLEDVTIGTITVDKQDHTILIKDQAFVGGENFKSFTVGDMSVAKGTVQFGDGTKPVAYSQTFDPVAQIQTLETVTFNNIVTDAAVTISANAFKSDALKTVTFKDLKKKTATAAAEQITINAGAFAVNSAGESKEANKTISIGNIQANTDIKAGAFTGATGDAEGTYSYSATIKDIKPAGAGAVTLKITAAAFQGPAKGKVTYNLGEINVDMTAANVETGAFVGCTDADGVKNAVVKIGAYKKAFPSNSTFTLVKELTAATWEAESNVSKFSSPFKVTVNGDMTQKMYGDGGDGKVKELEILGNITKAGALTSFGSAVRTITFGTNKNVIAGAVAANAFKEAADKAETEEEIINVTYKCSEGNESIYNPIFVETSFGGTAEPRVVTLFTTEWAKNNIFENTSTTPVMMYPNGINRVQISTASVAVEGEDIEASVVAALNGQYKYGKLFIPKGKNLKYKVDAKATTTKNIVNVFSGHLDNDKIYMKQIDTYKGYYWIDATDADQVFVVRTSDMSAANILVEFVDDAEELNDAKNKYWFNSNDAEKNCLRYSPSAVVNQELQNNAEFKHQTIFMMANPAKYNLTFAKLNQYATPKKDLPQKSIYVVSPTDPQAAAGRLTVIFEDEIDNVENTTGIETIEEINVEKNAIYNLQGVRVNKAQKGIYIINGKKVVK